MNRLQKLALKMLGIPENVGEAKNKLFAAQTYLGQGPIWNKDNNEQYIKNGYAKNADVYAIVSAIAQKAAEIPVKLCYYEKGEEVSIDNHRALDLIQNPNEYQSRYDFIEQFIGYYLLTGNTYDYIRSSEVGDMLPVDMYVLPSHLMQVIQGESQYDPVKGYQINAAQAWSESFNKDEVIHVKSPQYLWGDGQELYGQSPITAAWTSIQTGNSGYEANKKGLDNMGPPGILFDKGLDGVADYLTEDQQSNLESKMRKISGSKRNGAIAVAAGNLGWINFGLSPVDLAIMETMQMTLNDVCNIYHVDPQLFGSQSAKTYSNYEQARKKFYTDAVMPTLDKGYSKLSKGIIPRYKDLPQGTHFKPDYSKVAELQADFKEMTEWLSKAWWLTGNEAREKMGYDRKEDEMMDEVFINQGRVPLTLAGLSAEEVAANMSGDSLSE